MPGWYVSRGGKVAGPLTAEEVSTRLAKGTLAYFDLAFRKGAGASEGVWRAIAEIPAFNKVSLDLKIGSWVILRVRDGQAPRQDGPYSTAAVLEFLALGEILYSDSVWSQGHAAWRRIGDVDELISERLRGPTSPARVPGGPSADPSGNFSGDARPLPNAARLLENVMLLKKELMSPEPPPPETDGVDLVNPKSGDFLGLFSSVAFAVFIFGLTAGLAASPSVRADGASAPAPASGPVAAPVQGKILEIVPLKLWSTAPQLIFRTNASASDVIEVRIRAKTGEILKYASFDKVVRIARAPGEIASLDLASLGLVPGAYQVEATLGELKTTAAIFLGTKDQNFDEQLERHQKEISERQQSEKKALFYSAQILESLARKLTARGGPAAGESFKTELKKARAPIQEFLLSPRNEMAYPDELFTIEVLADTLAKKLAELGRPLDTNQSKKRAIASEQTTDKVTDPAAERLVQDLAKLRQSVSLLSSQ